MTVPELSRRSLLALSAGAALAAGGATSAAGAGLDLATPAGRLRAYMLMRGALDDRLVIGCLTARYYGVVETEVTPVFGVVSATFARFRPAVGGGYEGASLEVPFFTDLETGKVMDSWKNPYTGENVSVPKMAFPPARIAIAPDMTLSVPNPPPGFTLDHKVLASPGIGDDVWIVEQTITAMQIPRATKSQHYTEIVTLHARSSDLMEPDAKRVRCETAYDSISSWRSWMEMADHPGHLSGIGFGRYGAAIDELPPAWLDVVRAEKPDLLKDPGAALAPLMKA
jgi:hypothetical protein